MPPPDLTYRSVQPSDFEQLKLLHEEFFPVRYNDSFYTDTCSGVGINGDPLFSVIATAPSLQDSKEGESEPPAPVLVGFILAQFLDLDSCGESDSGLFNTLFFAAPRRVFYVLTIGVAESHRGRGVGAALLGMTLRHAAAAPDCGCVSGALSCSYPYSCCCSVPPSTY